MISVFSRHLLSLDWDYDHNHLTSFPSIHSVSLNNEKRFHIELLSALPNNQKSVLVSKKRKLYLYSKEYDENKLYNRREGEGVEPKETL